MEELKLTSSAGPAPEVPAAEPGRPSAEDDFDLDADFARLIAAIDAGRCRIPGERELDGRAVSVSLGDAADLDPRSSRRCAVLTALAARP